MDLEQKLLSRNIPKIYILGGLWMFLLPMAILVPFFNSRSLSMEQVFQLQAIFSFGVLVLEIPSGYVSDLLGRKKTLIWACFFHGAGFAMFPFCDSFFLFVIAEIFLAFAVSLFSGTDVALLYDTLEALGHKSEHNDLLGKRVFIYQMGETTAAIIGGILAGYALDLPVNIHAISAWLPLLMAFTLIEPERELFEKKGHLENIQEIKQKLFKESPLVKLILLNSMVWGASTLIAVWTFQPYWKNLGFELKYFGILWAIINIVVGITGKFAKKIEAKLGSVNTLVIMALLPIIGYIGMGFSGSLISATICICFQVSRALNQVIIRDALNTRVSSKMRATANSIAGMGTRVVFIFLGPLMGYLMDNKGANGAFFLFAGIFSFCFIIFMLPLLKLKNQFR